MTVQLITLDLDNTLWETEPVIIRAEQACFQWLEQHCPSVTQLYSLESFREYKHQLAQSYPQWQHQISKLRLEALRRAIMQAGCDIQVAEEKAQQAFDVFMQARNRVTLFDGVPEVLSQLKQRYSLIALTNGNADLAMIGIQDLFDACFHAEQTGAAKPAPDLFLAALKYTNLDASQAIHAGDHQEQDILAAKQLGYKTVWVNLKQQRWQYSDNQPDQTIQKISQLPDAIAKIISEND